MKTVLMAAMVLTLFTMNKKANAQQGFSVCVKTIPLFSFLQNQDDRDNCSTQQKASTNINLGIWSGYNFTPSLGTRMKVLYARQGQGYKINRNKTNQRVEYLKIPACFAYNNYQYKPVAFIEKIGPRLIVLKDSMLTDDNCHTLKSNPDAGYVRGQKL